MGAGGVDAFYAVDVDAEDLAAILDVDHLLIAVGGMRVGGGFALELLGRFGRHLSQHALEPFDLGHAAFLGKALAHSVERVGEPLGLDRKSTRLNSSH